MTSQAQRTMEEILADHHPSKVSRHPDTEWREHDDMEEDCFRHWTRTVCGHRCEVSVYVRDHEHYVGWLVETRDDEFSGEVGLDQDSTEDQEVEAAKTAATAVAQAMAHRWAIPWRKRP